MICRGFVVECFLFVKYSLTPKHSSIAQVCVSKSVENSMFDDAGLKDHPISFNQFTENRKRGFVAKSFYHLLGSLHN